MPNVNPNLMAYSQNCREGCPNQDMATVGWVYYRSNSTYIQSYIFSDGYVGFKLLAGRTTGTYRFQRRQEVTPNGGSHPPYRPDVLPEYEVGKTYCISAEIKATDGLSVYMATYAKNNDTVYPTFVEQPTFQIPKSSEEEFASASGYTVVYAVFTVTQEFLDAYRNGTVVRLNVVYMTTDETLSDTSKEMRVKLRNYKIEESASYTPWIPQIGEALYLDYAPMYDRTEADVNAIKAIIAKIESDGYSSLSLAEKDAWLADSKGCLNVQDLIRISTTCNYIAVRLNALGYSVSADLKEDWKRTDYMTPALSEALVTKLHNLYTAMNDLFVAESNYRVVFGGGQQTGLTSLPISYAILAEPSWASLDLSEVTITTLDYSTITEWNAIERFLYQALDFLESIGG